jgi:hypothetical protein
MGRYEGSILGRSADSAGAPEVLLTDGTALGLGLGVTNGPKLGQSEGSTLGIQYGSFEGLPNGPLLGQSEGSTLRIQDGSFEGLSNGLLLGQSEGSTLGIKDGSFEGLSHGILPLGTIGGLRFEGTVLGIGLNLGAILGQAPVGSTRGVRPIPGVLPVQPRSRWYDSGASDGLHRGPSKRHTRNRANILTTVRTEFQR